MIDKACAVIGGTRGEQQALVNYWRQRLAVANSRGVAKVIKARTPSELVTTIPFGPTTTSATFRLSPLLCSRGNTSPLMRARACHATPLCLPQ